MPASKKVTRDDIIAGALDVLRENGFSAVNARNVAKKLGCSTQPIYLSFQNMEELKQALTEKAVAAHTERVLALLHDNNGLYSRYSAYGIGFVRFAEQEKQLFRWLYLEDGQNGRHQDDVLMPEIIKTICCEYGYDRTVAEKFHHDMVIYSYGLAILMNTGHLSMTDDQLVAAFQRQFKALSAVYGAPPKMPTAKKLNQQGEE